MEHFDSANQRAVDYWKNLWQDFQSPKKESDGWSSPWMKEDADGNPIFTAYSLQKRKGIRIIQCLFDDDINWWLDTFGAEDPINELVISCNLSKNNIEFAKILMSQWIEDDLP